MEFLNLTLGHSSPSSVRLQPFPWLSISLIARAGSRLSPLRASGSNPVSGACHAAQPHPAAPLAFLRLIGMALLLLAIAEFQFGGRQGARRDHVLVMDTSAWMAHCCPSAQSSGCNSDGPGPRQRPRVAARSPHRGSHSAGPRRRPRHARHFLGNRSPQHRARHPRIAAGSDGFESVAELCSSPASCRAAADRSRERSFT